VAVRNVEEIAGHGNLRIAKLPRTALFRYAAALANGRTRFVPEFETKHVTGDNIQIAKKSHISLTGGKACVVEGFVMASKFAIGEKVHQAFSNHAEGTVIAIFTDQAGGLRYAVEMFGHRTIQIADESSLVARDD